MKKIIAPTNSLIKVDKGIPFQGKYGSFMSTIRSMEIGDSFLWPRDKRHGIANRISTLKGKKFSSRTVDAEHIRVWRVS